MLHNLNNNVFFQQIWNRAGETREVINNKVNPLWKRYWINGKSGLNNKNSVIEAIRVLTWGFEVDRRSKVNARSEVSRAKSATPSEEIDYETAYKHQYTKISRNANASQWYPSFWLSFLLMGFAAGDDGRTVLGAGTI